MQLWGLWVYEALLFALYLFRWWLLGWEALRFRRRRSGLCGRRNTWSLLWSFTRIRWPEERNTGWCIVMDHAIQMTERLLVWVWPFVHLVVVLFDLDGAAGLGAQGGRADGLSATMGVPLLLLSLCLLLQQNKAHMHLGIWMNSHEEMVEPHPLLMILTIQYISYLLKDKQKKIYRINPNGRSM